MGVSASRDAGPPPQQQQQHTLAARTLHPGSAGPGPGSCRNCRDLSSPPRGSEAETHASSFPASSTARSLGMASMQIAENRGKRPAITRTHRGHAARLRSRGKKVAFVLDEAEKRSPRSSDYSRAEYLAKGGRIYSNRGLSGLWGQFFLCIKAVNKDL